jgi:hypothetical protein
MRIGSGNLGEGRNPGWYVDGSLACVYDFTVGVPTAERYEIDYPGGLSTDYTFAALESSGWKVAPVCCRFVPAN